MREPPFIPAGQLHWVSRGGDFPLWGFRLLLSDPNLTKQTLLALPAQVGWGDLRFASVVTRRRATAFKYYHSAAGGRECVGSWIQP